MHVHTTTSLRIHAFAINKLHDPNWTGMELYDELKQWWRGRREPKELFHKILKNGVLFHLGKIVFDEYHDYDSHLEKLEGEYKMWFLEEHIEFIKFHYPRRKKQQITAISEELTRIDKLYESDEHAYWTILESDKFYNWFLTQYFDLNSSRSSITSDVREAYAYDFSNRTFNDLPLCTHINKRIRDIGISSQIDDEPFEAWVKRTKIPKWAERAVVTRDNGLCVSCKRDLLREFTAPRHIDHIIPLKESGINDLVNLQLMCDKCNLKKKANELDPFTSIPDYLQVGLTRR
ncbi:HNH endonuclease [Gimesia aquarii]|uniref:HNH endonuclease n=1 Tax=Gimesia aquarii TaxID=2527964 RepID=A0A517VQR8_9PLAN|nr:HNH endonuclease signature motif containing protein [Gimesia aquarii]QDT95368.1 HNH endonuclease [Gimesia aquarii]